MSDRQYKIGIDPGHGGRDPGAVGPSGVHESDVNLGISLALEALLVSAGCSVVMTRRKDVTFELTLRDDVFDNAGVDYVVSVHCNSSGDPNPNYVATFIQATGGQAEQLALKVQAQLVAATGWKDGGVRTQNLHMTRETNAPAILVECGFISNPQQERQLADPGFQQRLAKAIALGILEYLGKEGVPVAEQWKLDIIAEAKQAGLIAVDHDPDEPATKWFVLAIALGVMKKVLKG